jgi:hypothetical protein
MMKNLWNWRENSKVVATVKDQQEIADTQNIYKINFSIYYKKERKNFSRS